MDKKIGGVDSHICGVSDCTASALQMCSVANNSHESDAGTAILSASLPDGIKVGR